MDEEVILNPENKEDLDNLALLTNTICNYEEIVSPADIRGFYWFLRSNIKNYSLISINENGVQIMTVHGAKGLEFPVTILASLQLIDSLNILMMQNNQYTKNLIILLTIV